VDDFDVYDEVYRRFFSEPYATRVTVGSTLLPGFLIEVDAIEDTCWIPKSQIGPLSEVNEKGDEGPLQIPQWLAEEKGLD